MAMRNNVINKGMRTAVAPGFLNTDKLLPLNKKGTNKIANIEAR